MCMDEAKDKGTPAGHTHCREWTSDLAFARRRLYLSTTERPLLVLVKEGNEKQMASVIS